MTIHILDVRSGEEFEGDHVDGALNIPLDQLMQGVLPPYINTEKIYVHCLSGVRSKLACQILKQQGFACVYDIGTLENAKKLNKDSL